MRLAMPSIPLRHLWIQVVGLAFFRRQAPWNRGLRGSQQVTKIVIRPHDFEHCCSNPSIVGGEKAVLNPLRETWPRRVSRLWGIRLPGEWSPRPFRIAAADPDGLVVKLIYRIVLSLAFVEHPRLANGGIPHREDRPVQVR